LAGDATVEESAMLRHAITGELREVDVVVKSLVAGYQLLVGVEATAGGRRADVQWVERMVAKHEHLPTNKLVLVASAGFTLQARTLAVAGGAVPLAPEDVAESESHVLGQLRSLWPKAFELRVERVTISVRREGSEALTVIENAPPDLDVILPDGTAVGTLHECVRGSLNADPLRLADQMGLGDITEDVEGAFSYDVPTPTVSVNGVSSTICLRWQRTDGTFSAHPIERLEAAGRLIITVDEMSLTQMRIGEASVAYGEIRLLGQPATFVVTASEARRSGTMRLRPKGGAGPQDNNVLWIDEGESDGARP
jgi:hypothetical protein